MSDNATLYERTVQTLKNKKVVVVILLMFAVVVGLSKFLTEASSVLKFFTPNKQSLRIVTSIQQYDLMAEVTDSPKLFAPIDTESDDIERIVSLIADQVVEHVQPERDFTVQLDIEGNVLKTSKPLIAYVHSASPLQEDPLVEKISETNSLDLLPFLRDPYFHPEVKNFLAISVKDRKGYFKREHISIFKTNDDLSFDETSKAPMKKIQFEPRISKILLEPFKVSGANSEIEERIQVQFDSALRMRINGYNFLGISPMSRDDLLRKRDEIRSLPLGEAKSRLTDQYNVDFIVSGNITIENN